MYAVTLDISAMPWRKCEPGDSADARRRLYFTTIHTAPVRAHTPFAYHHPDAHALMLYTLHVAAFPAGGDSL